MGRARGALAEQRGNREALAGADFEGGVLTSPRMAAFALHAALLDDVEVLHRAFVRMQDRLALGIEAQLAVLHQTQQVTLLHVVERRVLLQELDGALDVLQDRGLACFGKGICLAHGASGFLVMGLEWAACLGRQECLECTARGGVQRPHRT